MTAGPLLPIRLADLPRQRTGGGSGPYLPDPAAGPPSQEWIRRSSHRRRLELAFAILRHHGIPALPAFGAAEDADADRRRLEEVVDACSPGAERPYVFWGGADDRACFTPDGRLCADLPLRTRAILIPMLTTALAAVGLIGRLDRDTGRYVVAHGLPF